MCDWEIAILSSAITSVLAWGGIALTHFFETRREKEALFLEKEFSILSTINSAFYSLMHFIGEGSDSVKQIDSLHPELSCKA